MNDSLIPGRYAKALYKVAEERNCAPRIYALMQTLGEHFLENSDFRSALKNPFITFYDKEALIATAAGATAEDKTFSDFLKLLNEHRRVDFIGAIAFAFTDLYRKENNIHRVEIVSASKLDARVEDRIKSLVEKHLPGGTLEFSTLIDPAIIGGFIINVDNERLDASLETQLKEIRQNLIK